MLLNLLENGLDAVEEGGRVELSARSRHGSDTVEIRVSDNGCGIPEEAMSRLFTPFFTTKEMGEGTGLGLAIVYGIVKMHMGEIEVDSEPGAGTTFTVRLPVEADVESKETEPVTGEMP
ncbi:MAG: ATP-binding protein [Candidatus Brocadiia bacterium]